MHVELPETPVDHVHSIYNIYIRQTEDEKYTQIQKNSAHRPLLQKLHSLLSLPANIKNAYRMNILPFGAYLDNKIVVTKNVGGLSLKTGIHRRRHLSKCLPPPSSQFMCRTLLHYHTEDRAWWAWSTSGFRPQLSELNRGQAKKKVV